jgi:signal transduction histidine kinase
MWTQALSSFLADDGWQTVTAASGEEALGILQENASIAILATDYLMPGGINGAQLVNRALAFNPDLYTIVFTSQGLNPAVESLHSGVAAYIMKSHTAPDDMRDAVRRGVQAITLSRIGRQLLDLDSEDAILDLIMGSLGRIKELDGCCIAVRGSDAGWHVERALDLRSREELAHGDIEQPDSAYRYVIESRRPYFPPLFAPAGTSLLPYLPEAKSLAVVPLALKGMVKGALGIEHREENHFSIEDLRFLNQVAQWVTLAMDKLTQQERFRLERERGRERRYLLARAALHEIKNPLNNLAAAVQVASEAVDTEIRNSLLDNVGRINGALNRILRPLIRDEDAEDEPIDIEAAIQESVSRFRVYHAEEPTRIIVKASPALPTVKGHRTMLVSALVNLYENGAAAAEGVETGAEIRVTADYVASRDQVEVVVKDNGSGIPSHLLERVFDYGVTSDKTHGHSGYGLAFAKDVVSWSGGTIAVANSDKHGTTLKLTFPVGDSGTLSTQVPSGDMRWNGARY